MKCGLVVPDDFTATLPLSLSLTHLLDVPPVGCLVVPCAGQDVDHLRDRDGDCVDGILVPEVMRLCEVCDGCEFTNPDCFDNSMLDLPYVGDTLDVFLVCEKRRDACARRCGPLRLAH